MCSVRNNKRANTEIDIEGVESDREPSLYRILIITVWKPIHVIKKSHKKKDKSLCDKSLKRPRKVKVTHERRYCKL